MRTPLQTPPARRASNRFATLVLLVLAPAMIVLGWRALLVVAGVVCVSLAADTLLREPRHNPRRWPIRLPVEALLLAALLPAQLAGGVTSDEHRHALWPLLLFAGIALSLLRRLRELVPRPAFDPIAVVMVVLFVVAGDQIDPRATLQRGIAFRGDVVRAEAAAAMAEPWYDRPRAAGQSATLAPWAARNLQRYLDADGDLLKHGAANLDGLIRDRLPPLEDLVLIGHPAPIGMTSGIVLLGVILWGAYRRTIDYRIPLIGITTMYLALVLLPVPTSFGGHGPSWHFFAALRPDVGPATALTFVHYLLFASPALFAIGLLATRGDVRPIQPRAIVAWSMLLGVTVAASILYGSVVYGPYVILLFAPPAGRWLDRLLARRPLSLPPP